MTLVLMNGIEVKMNYKVFGLILCLLWTPILCQAQSDTAKLRRDFSNVLIREECIAGHIVGDTQFVIDSLVPQSFVSNCQGYQGAIAFVRDTTVADANIAYLNDVILKNRPDFALMCGVKRATGPVFCSWSQ